MFPDEDPTAQDPNAPEGQIEVDDQNDSEGEDQKEKKVGEAAEKRIAELTAKFHESERQRQAANERLLDAVASRQPQARTEPEEEDDPNLDPVTKAYLDRKLSKVQREAFMRTQQLQAQYNASLLSQEAVHLAREHGADPEQVKKLATYAASKGIPMSAEEIVDMEIGKAVREGRYNAPDGSQAPPVRRGTQPLGSVRTVNLTPPAAVANKPLPPNFDELSPDQQIAILNKRGVGDKPL